MCLLHLLGGGILHLELLKLEELRVREPSCSLSAFGLHRRYAHYISAAASRAERALAGLPRLVVI